MRTALGLLLLAVTHLAFADQPSTIPALREWTEAPGSYTFGAGTRIVLDSSSADDLSTTASLFATELLALTGVTVPVLPGAATQPGDIVLTLGAADPAIGDEGYLLTIADRITVSAQTAAGVLYGTRSILQMLRHGFQIQAGAARDWPDFPERALMIDVGRKYFSLPFLERHIRDLAYLKLNYLHLHLSDNQGFRIESSSHPEIPSTPRYTKAEMANLIALARGYHVMVVPEIDVPSHAGAMLARHPELALPGTGKLDLSKPASYSLVGDLLAEYMPLFPAPFWHTGADEYLAPAEYANYPQLLNYARQRYGPQANAQDVYLGFVNWVDGIVKAQGKQLRAWNDVYEVTGSTQTPNSDIVLEMWWPFLSPQDALAKGHTIMNSELFTLYYVLGGGRADPANLYSNWAPNKQWVTGLDNFGGPVYQDLPASTPGIRGGKFHVWCDTPDAQTEEQIQDGIFDDLRGVAQNSWGSPKLAPTYGQFLGIMDAIGHAPDWGPDFALMPASGGATVSAGQTATLQLRVAAIGGFNQQVALSCGFLTPQNGMTCSVSPALLTPTAAVNAPPVTLSVRTTAAASALWFGFLLAGALAAGLVLEGGIDPARSFSSAFGHNAGLKPRAVLMLALLLAAAGCGSSSGSGSTPTPTPTPTPIVGTSPGTYQVQVTASAGSLTHSIAMSVTVTAAGSHALRRLLTAE